ncbi:hypothetical protein ACIQCM_07430 [Pseudarthrobacter sp. NPDC092439]|uniref:hypothetical protein n=1 Tax=unclassified Pseudarthrobacter TaxID=2647000 RepID=UPI00381185E1
MSPEHSPAERREVTVRRAPKYVPFLVLGAVVGIAAAAVVAYALPGSDSFDPGAVFGFFLVMFAGGGAILGAVLALILDRRSLRRQQRAIVESVPEEEQENTLGDEPETGPRS